MIIRIVGAVIILLTAVTAGICLSYVAKTRIKRLSAMVSSLYILSGDISLWNDKPFLLHV